MKIVILCTANQCRSPMAEGLLRQRLAERGLDADVGVSSAGFLSEGRPATEAAVLVMAGRGVDISAHVSRKAEQDLLRRADLVLAMARIHVREALVDAPDLLDRTFTLKEIVRRGEETGPRAPDETLPAWFTRISGGRTATVYLGDASVDDIADPVGLPMRTYKKTAKEIDGLLERFVALAWPP
jgi:protein-tyrosine phosphatase